MSNCQTSPLPPTRLPLRTVLLCGAGGSIALHLGVFATSPLWFDAMDRPLATEPVELLMLDATAIAPPELASQPATPLIASPSDTTAIDPTPIALPASFPPTVDRFDPPPQTQPQTSPPQDHQLHDPTPAESSDTPESPETSHRSQNPETKKPQETRGMRHELGEVGSSNSGGGAGETGSTGDRANGEGQGVPVQGMIVRSGRGPGGRTGRISGAGVGTGNGTGTGSGVGMGTGTGTGSGSGTGVGMGTGNRSSGGRGTASRSSSQGVLPRESTGATSGGISCTDGCEGRYQGSQTEVIEHDPLIRAYRNANGELEFELIQSSGSAEADRAALTTAQQASYTSDRDEFTIRARIAEDASASPPVQDSTPISEAPPATPPEPAYEEPAYDEPVYEEPIYEEPVYEEPIYEEPVYEEPVYEEPIHEASTAEEPAYAEPTSEEPVSEEPSGEASTTEEPLNDTGDES